MSFRNAVQHSLRSTYSVQAQSRHREILETETNPAKRSILLRMHSMVVGNPSLMAALFRIQLPPEVNLEKIGHGYVSDVYRRKDGGVLKIVNATASLSPSEQLKIAQKMQREHLALRAGLGSIVVPHQVFVAPHPALEESTVVQIKQPFVTAKDAAFTTPARPEVDHERLVHLQRTYPGMTDALTRVVEGSEKLYQEHALSTDTNGNFNFGITPLGQLKLIDAQPVTDEHPDVQELIGQQLQGVRASLTR